VAYQILARKYRPSTFDEMVGQKAVVQTLKNALQSGRIAQAYLFSGMRGVGKTSAARILAKALNCVNGPTATPCNACDQCLSISEDRSIDVMEIDGASNRGIDDIRQLREIVRYKPLHDRYKVIIIDEVHQVTGPAFNALLKTLEEPPPQTVFIFATTEFQKVPATIVSRCQHFEFKKISQKDITNHLLKIAQKEGIQISNAGLTLLAESAEGSLRDAESLLDQAVAFSGTTVPDEDLKEILGTLNRDILFGFSSAVLDEKPEAIFGLVEQVIDGGYDLRFFAKELIQHFRDLLLTKSVAKPDDLLGLGPEDVARLRREVERASAEDLLRYLVTLQASEQAIRYSSHPRITIETLLLKLCHYQSLTPIQDLIEAVGKWGPEEASPAPGPARPSPAVVRGASGPAGPKAQAAVPSPVVQAASAVPPPAARLESLKTLMPKILTYLQRDRSSLAAILAQASSWKVEDEPLDIKFNHDQGFSVSNPLTLCLFFPPQKEELLEVVEKEIKLIEKAAGEAAGQKVHVKACVEAADGPRSRASELDTALKDPGVQHFMDTFRARIVSTERLTKTGDQDSKGRGR
jgi:DNA polymerase-3 subunit gamma/tau